MLAAELTVEVFTQFNGQLIRGAEEQHAPDIAQQINHHCDNHQRADPHPHLLCGVMFFSHAIDHNPHYFRRD